MSQLALTHTLNCDPHTLVSETRIVGCGRWERIDLDFPSHGIGPPALEDSAGGQGRRAPACSSHISNGAARVRLDDARWSCGSDGAPESATVLSGVLSFHRTLDKCCHSMPGWGVQQRSGRSTIIHFKIESAPELAACKCTRRTGDLGLFTTSTAHTWVGWTHPWVGMSQTFANFFSKVA